MSIDGTRSKRAGPSPEFLEDPSLGVAELVGLVHAKPSLLRSARNTQRLLRHPAAGAGLVREIAADLPWKNLALASRDMRIAPALRAELARALVARLDSLGLGERIALARMAPREVLRALLREESADRVREAARRNPFYRLSDEGHTGPTHGA